MNLNILKTSKIQDQNIKLTEINKNVKQIKIKPNQVGTIDGLRGRNSRQFGSDITNYGNISTMQNCRPLEKKVSVVEKETCKIIEPIPRKQSIRLLESKGDTTCQNNKMDICENSFGYNANSSMLLDEPIMTRNQHAEKLAQLNPQLAIEYLESIVDTIFQSEMINYSFYPYPNYMKQFQVDINEKMRVILFDWIVDVHLKWKLLPETLYLTFNLIDRFLGVKVTSREELQCVGVSALLIACKYEEIYFPDLSDFREITDNSFTKKEILTKEYEILKYLNFDITVPSALRFFEVFNVHIKLDEKQKIYAMYLLELSIFNYQLIKYKPSLIASGVMMLLVNCNRNLKEKLVSICKHSLEELSSICKDIIYTYQKTDHGSKSISRKYSSSKYFGIGEKDILVELTNGI